MDLEYENGSQALIINSLGILGIYPEILVAGTKGALRLKYGKIFLESNKKYSLFQSIIFAFRESLVIPFRILRNPLSGSCRYFVECLLSNRINESDEKAAGRVLKITALAEQSYIEKRSLSVRL